MAITSTGLGSGLDVNAIITGLMAIENKPLDALTKQKTAYQSKISAYGTLSSALTTFQTSASALSTASKFNAQTLTSSNSAVLTATSNGTATVGNYDITVSQLAKTQKLSSNGFTNTSDVVGTGKLTIAFGTYTAVGNSFVANAAKANITVDITSGNNTLTGVRDAINAANASVSASIVNDGTTNRLVITSKDSGEVNSLKITADDDDNADVNASGLSQLAYDPTLTAGTGKNMLQMQAAQNAILNIDGIVIQKPSNTISDAIEGVTLNLLATSSSAAISLGVASNQDAIKKSVTEFVDAYNKLDTTLRSLTYIDPTNKDNNGRLVGDAAIRTISSQLKAVMTQTVGNGTINSLNEIGVTFQRDGKMALDATVLSSVVNTNFADIAKLFSSSITATDPQITFASSTSKSQAGTYAVNVTQIGTTLVNYAGSINGAGATGSNTGLTGAPGDSSEGLGLKISGGALGARGTVQFTIGYAAQLDNLIKDMLSTGGLLSAKTDGFNTSIKRVDEQSDRLKIRLTAIEARYKAQYTSLDTTLSNMKNTSSYLTQQIATLNANA